jgi:hypothetical protein
VPVLVEGKQSLARAVTENIANNASERALEKAKPALENLGPDEPDSVAMMPYWKRMGVA